jgi:DNA polymerase epsilon subunit 4
MVARVKAKTMAGENDQIAAEIPESEADTAPVEEDSEKSERLVKFPITRIKTIIKTDPDVVMAGQDAVILIAKATVTSGNYNSL